MTEFLAAHWLDMLTTVLGLAYILLEYKASIWLWAVGFAMQSLGIVLYYQKGLYADCGMEFYYLAMTVYGFINWIRPHQSHQNENSEKDYRNNQSNLNTQNTQNTQNSQNTQNTQSPPSSSQKPITHFPKRLAVIWGFATLAIWAALYMFLAYCTDSRVPVADSFTTALSFVGIWALARKYLEQWLIWIVVDVVTCVLYFYKDIPFKASLYGLYVVIAVMGYFKWKKMMKESFKK